MKLMDGGNLLEILEYIANCTNKNLTQYRVVFFRLAYKKERELKIYNQYKVDALQLNTETLLA